jgi:hypothetical protein
MSFVAILCPKTGQRVSTGLEMERSTFDALPLAYRTVDCWACGGQHIWSRRWATLIECDSPEARRAGIPIDRVSAPAA